MELTGSLMVRVTTSRANLPVAGTSVAITTTDNSGKFKLVNLIVTDENGVAGPIRLPAPYTSSEGTTPGGPIPFSFYSIWVEHPGYQLIHIQDVQVFPGVESVQDVTLVPLSGTPLPDNGNISGAQAQDL